MKPFRQIGLVLLLLMPAFADAQSVNDEQLAVQYFQKGEFELAVMYYERLYEKSRSPVYYEYYYRCLVALERFKEAEKLAKRQMRRDPGNLTYYVDLGTLFKAMGNENKATQQFVKAIKALTPDHKQITDLANAFIEKNEPDQALACYQKGKKLLKNNYDFNFDIATVMGIKGDYEGMVDVYLDLLLKSERYLQGVQTALDRTLDLQDNEAQSKLLKDQLLRYIRKYPQKTIFSEMLIWLFVQKKQFNAAFIQTKALDKREKDEGERVLNLGRLCRSNFEYDIAVKCFRYVIEKGPLSPNYTPAKMEWLETMHQKITKGNYTPEELTSLESSYTSTLKELGKTAKTALLMRRLAHLKAFYLDHKPEAIALLEHTLKLPGMSRNNIAETKLELGDILVLNGQIWDASLYYSQVDHDFKNDMPGHEAKYRNAKISFYTGNFIWAQAQLDILKTSTSKLISNDAMDLSLLITDNLNLDTTSEAMSMYAKADLLLFQNQFDPSVAIMDSILTAYPGHALSDEIIFQKYRIAHRKQQFEAAARHLKTILAAHGHDILGDDAAFYLGELYQLALHDDAKAIEYYEKLLTDYPGSLYVVEARERYRQLKGDEPPAIDTFKKIE